MLGSHHWWEVIIPALHPYSDWRMGRRGKRDAKAEPPIPRPDSEDQPPKLNQLLSAGNQEMRILAREWHRADRAYLQAWSMSKERLATAEKVHNDAKESFDSAFTEYETANKRPLLVMPSWWGYPLLLTLLCAFELPLNERVFRGTGLSEAFVLLATLGIASVLGLSAHFLGLYLREPQTKIRPLLIGLCIIFPCSVIAALAFMRDSYLGHKAGVPPTLNSNLLVAFFAAAHSCPN